LGSGKRDVSTGQARGICAILKLQGGKPVVSAKRGVSTRQARGICCDLETPRDKRVGSTANVAVASAVSQIFNELTSQ